MVVLYLDRMLRLGPRLVLLLNLTPLIALQNELLRMVSLHLKLSLELQEVRTLLNLRQIYLRLYYPEPSRSAWHILCFFFKPFFTPTKSACLNPYQLSVDLSALRLRRRSVDKILCVPRRAAMRHLLSHAFCFSSFFN